MAGYSGTPLAKKLGIKEGFKILAVNAPEGYPGLLAHSRSPWRSSRSSGSLPSSILRHARA